MIAYRPLKFKLNVAVLVDNFLLTRIVPGPMLNMQKIKKIGGSGYKEIIDQHFSSQWEIIVQNCSIGLLTKPNPTDFLGSTGQAAIACVTG